MAGLLTPTLSVSVYTSLVCLPCAHTIVSATRRSRSAAADWAMAWQWLGLFPSDKGRVGALDLWFTMSRWDCWFYQRHSTVFSWTVGTGSDISVDWTVNNPCKIRVFCRENKGLYCDWLFSWPLNFLAPLRGYTSVCACSFWVLANINILRIKQRWNFCWVKMFDVLPFSEFSFISNSSLE